MGFSWTGFAKKLKQFGRPIAGMFIPGLESSIQAVEELVDSVKDKSMTGTQKKAAAIAAATQLVISFEGAVGEDILNDPKVIEATSEAVDAIVSAHNARTNLLEAIEAAKAARNPKGEDTPGS